MLRPIRVTPFLPDDLSHSGDGWVGLHGATGRQGGPEPCWVGSGGAMARQGEPVGSPSASGGVPLLACRGSVGVTEPTSPSQAVREYAASRNGWCLMAFAPRSVRTADGEEGHMGDERVREALGRAREVVLHLRYLELYDNVLSFDRWQACPPPGFDFESEASGFLERLLAAELTGPYARAAVDALRGLSDVDFPGDIDRGVARCLIRRHDEASRLPTDLVEERTRMNADARRAWEAAERERTPVASDALCAAARAVLGADPARIRPFKTHHPVTVCAGPRDARPSTFEDGTARLLDTVLAMAHETGHACTAARARTMWCSRASGAASTVSCTRARAACSRTIPPARPSSGTPSRPRLPASSRRSRVRTRTSSCWPRTGRTPAQTARRPTSSPIRSISWCATSSSARCPTGRCPWPTSRTSGGPSTRSTWA